MLTIDYPMLTRKIPTDNYDLTMLTHDYAMRLYDYTRESPEKEIDDSVFLFHPRDYARLSNEIDVDCTGYLLRDAKRQSVQSDFVPGSLCKNYSSSRL